MSGLYKSVEFLTFWLLLKFFKSVEVIPNSKHHDFWVSLCNISQDTSSSKFKQPPSTVRRFLHWTGGTRQRPLSTSTTIQKRKTQRFCQKRKTYIMSLKRGCIEKPPQSLPSPPKKMENAQRFCCAELGVHRNTSLWRGGMQSNNNLPPPPPLSQKRKTSILSAKQGGAQRNKSLTPSFTRREKKNTQRGCRIGFRNYFCTEDQNIFLT